MIVIVGGMASAKSLYASQFYRDGLSVLEDARRGVFTDAEVIVTMDSDVVADLYPEEVHYLQRLPARRFLFWMLPQMFRVRVFELDERIGVHVEKRSFIFKASDYLEMAATHHPEYIDRHFKGLL